MNKIVLKIGKVYSIDVKDKKGKNIHYDFHRDKPVEVDETLKIGDQKLCEYLLSKKRIITDRNDKIERSVFELVTNYNIEIEKEEVSNG